MRSRRIAYLGMLTALAFIFSYVETLLPVSVGIPGMKLGLANIVIVVALYYLGARDAFCLSIVRMILVAFTFSNLSALLYSLAGGMLSFAVMSAAKKADWFSVTGVSVLGGIFHNIGQIIMAFILLQSAYVMTYLPVLLIAGTISGVVVGMLSAAIANRTGKIMGGI